MIKRIGAVLAGITLALLGATVPAQASRPLPVPVKGLATVAGFARPLTGCAPSCIYYNSGQDAISPEATSVTLALDVAKPTFSTANGDRHSLAEMSVQSASTNQTIELGWTVDPSVNGGSLDPYLFSGAWVNGVFQGYNAAGGFKACGVAGTSCTSPSVTVGTSALSWVGTLKTFSVQYDSATSSWWLYANGSALGRYLASEWVSPTFTSAGFTQGFGEVASTHDYVATGTAPCAAMGNGLPGTNTGAARVASLTFGGTTATPSFTLHPSTYPSYVDMFNAPTTTRTFRYGGIKSPAC